MDCGFLDSKRSKATDAELEAWKSRLHEGEVGMPELGKVILWALNDQAPTEQRLEVTLKRVSGRLNLHSPS